MKVDLEILFDDFMSFITLENTQDKHPYFHLIWNKLIIPIVVSACTSYLTIKLIMSLLVQ